MLISPQSPAIAKLALLLGLIGLLLGLLPGAHAALTDNLSARYDFNTGSGTNLTDSSPNNNHGLIIGGPAWGTGAGCLSGSCLNFTGSGQYVTVPSSSTLQGLYNFTIIGWAKFNAVGIVQTVLAKNNASSQQTFDISLNSGNGWNFLYYDTSGTLGDILSDPPGGVNTTQGICFAMTRDISLGTNNFKTYFNGVLKDQATKTNNQMALSPGTNLTIGRRGDGGQQVNASIDRVWIFSRVLNTSEMTTLCAVAEPDTDTTPPTVLIQSPTNTTYAIPSVWVNVTLDENTGNVTAQLDSTTNYSLANTTGNWNAQMTGLTNGAHSVRIFANDSSGNMNSSQTIYFTVNDIAPVWTLGTSPAANNNTNFSNFLTLDAGVYDAALNVANISIFNSTMFPWLYRETITITNNNASVILPLNYTVNLTFDHATLVAAGKSLANGSDVRILYNFSVELDRINITAFNTTTTTIRFRTRENISAGGIATNYELYYGNPHAGAPPANPDNVYLFYDNFSEYTSCAETAFNSTWTLGWDGASYPGSPLTGNCTIINESMQLDINGTSFNLGYYTNQSFPQDVSVSVRMRVNNGSAGGANAPGILYRYNYTNPTTIAQALPGLNYEYDNVASVFIRRYDEGSGGIYTSNLSEGVWYAEEARLYNTTWIHHINGIRDNVNLTLGASFLRPGRVGLTIYWTEGKINGTFDDVIVRRYISAEPSLTSAATTPPAQVVAYCSNTSWAGTAWNSSAECGTRNTSSWRETVYYFNLTASDDSGLNTTEYYRMNLTRNKFNFSIQVFKGWNLIGLWENQTLLNITNWTAAPANITVAQCFITQNQSWAKYNWTNSSGNSSYVCAKGLAAFILIGRNDTLNFTEITLNEWTPNAGGNWTANITLRGPGYNYLLVFGNVTLKNASTWPINGVRYASCWNASRQAYFSYLNTSVWAGGLGNTSLCMEGQGIVLQALGNETITLQRIFTYPASGEGYGFAYAAAAVLVLAGGAWAFRWYSRRGET